MKSALLENRIAYQADEPSRTGGKLQAWVVLNVEVWHSSRQMPRTILPPPMNIASIPDTANWAWHEYGMRVGFWRLRDRLKSLSITPTLSINSAVCDAYPDIARTARADGWDFMAHSEFQRPLPTLEDEEDAIARALDRLERHAGSRPKGWLSPGLAQSAATLDYLAKHGVEYVCDLVVDDKPCFVTTSHGTMTSIPYTVELNDIVVFALEKREASAFEQRVRDQLDVLAAEAETHERVLCVALHPYLSGVPHRIRYVTRALDVIRSHPAVEMRTGSQIAADFAARMCRTAGPELRRC